MPKRPSDFRAQWDALTAEAAALAHEPKALRGLVPQTAKAGEQEARVAALSVSMDAVAHAAWETTAQDLADLLLLAEIAWSLFWGRGTFPQLPADIEDRDQREVAVAYLVRGVFDAYSHAQAGTADGRAP